MILRQRILDGIREYAPILVFTACLLALYVFVSIGYLSVLGPVLGGTLGAFFAIVFLLVLNRHGDSDQAETTPDYRVPIVITCLYVGSMILMYRFVTYERPVAHYLVFGLFAGYISYEIATGASRVRVVPQILTLTFFTYWSSQFAFPAGMYGPDTRGRYLPVIREALSQGHISFDQITYIGHLLYVTESALVSGLSAKTSYYILATLVLTGTLLILAVLDIGLPRISREVALYSALLFGCMSWTIGRGTRPNKLNFFYPLILLIGFTALVLFSSASSTERKRWLVVGVTISPALIFGHRFSAGAAMVFLGAIGLFVVLYHTLLEREYTTGARGLTFGFIVAYVLGLFGNPVHTGPLLSRFSGLVQAVLAPISSSASTSATGGPGRYSELGLDLLLANTAGQAILFGLAVFGAALVLRQTEWEYDFVISWMGVLSLLLLVSLVFNAADVQPQRFYALLGILGLNVCAGATLVFIKQIRFRKLGPPLVATVVAVFVVASLVSPVAGTALSPFDDDIPHFRKYDTEQVSEGRDWAQTYTQDSLSIVAPGTEIPVERTSATRGKLILDVVDPGKAYVYSDVSNQAGVIVSGGLNIGGRNFVYVRPPSAESDSAIYSNGQTSVYLREPTDSSSNRSSEMSQ